MQKAVEALFSIMIGACGVMAITGSVMYVIQDNLVPAAACAILASACNHYHMGRSQCAKSTA